MCLVAVVYLVFLPLSGLWAPAESPFPLWVSRDPQKWTWLFENYFSSKGTKKFVPNETNKVKKEGCKGCLERSQHGRQSLIHLRLASPFPSQHVGMPERRRSSLRLWLPGVYLSRRKMAPLPTLQANTLIYRLRASSFGTSRISHSSLPCYSREEDQVYRLLPLGRRLSRNFHRFSFIHFVSDFVNYYESTSFFNSQRCFTASAYIVYE